MIWVLVWLEYGDYFCSFQMEGIELLLSDRLKSLVKYVVAIGPKCFKCWMFMSSGPVDLFVFEFLIVCMYVCCTSYAPVRHTGFPVRNRRLPHVLVLLLVVGCLCLSLGF